jgi:hypothetical protein
MMAEQSQLAGLAGHETMMTSPSGPTSVDWVGALVHGLHPMRWLLCLVGLLAMAALNDALPSSWGLTGPDAFAWLLNPGEKAATVAADLVGASAGGILWAALLLTVNTSLWCMIGGWISRHELVARQRAGADAMAEGPMGQQSSATQLLVKRWNSLLLCCPMVFVFFLILILPVLLMAAVSGLVGGMGTLLVSLILPVALGLDLCLLIVVLGAAAWPLMPLAIAAECRDAFDAVSRSYSYGLQRPVRFVLLTAVALAFAWLPFGGVAHAWAAATEGDVQNLPVPVLFAAAALSLSVFWSLETLVYLHLRAVVDEVDAAELAAGPVPAGDAKSTPSVLPQQSTAPASAKTVGMIGHVRGLLIGLVALTGAWALTIHLFTRVSRGPTDWLDWGLTGWTVAPVDGASVLYLAASLIAALWAVTSVILVLAMTVRRVRAARKAGALAG